MSMPDQNIKEAASTLLPSREVSRLTGPAVNPDHPARTFNACERCRLKKRKCTRGWPCRGCAAEEAECVYLDNKRERTKRELAASQEENEVLVGEVRKLKEERRDYLATARGQDDQMQGLTGAPSIQRPIKSFVSLGGGSGASGLIGKMSEISWLEVARENILLWTDSNYCHSGHCDSVRVLHATEMNYHLDEADLLAVNEDSMEEEQWPDLAGTMAGAFFDTIYPTFPFVDKEPFLQTLSTVRPQNTMPRFGANRRWAAMANIIFCLGSQWLFRGDANQPVGRDDHLIYYARARKLGLDHRVVLDHPTVEQVQMMGLLGLYLATNHQITRAWTVVGNSVRHATALGLHLQVESELGSVSEHRSRARTWYALYNLELFLVEVTGRPSCMISDLEITAPLEGVLEDTGRDFQYTAGIRPPDGTFSTHDTHRTPNPLSKYFSCRVQVSMICRQLSSSLYAAGQTGTWAELRASVRPLELQIQQLSVYLSYNSKLELWSPGSRHDIEFAMSIHSVQMILYRPFMFEWMGKKYDESPESQDSNRLYAMAAVASARSLIALLPADATRETLNWLFPSWSIVHHLSQAGAILTLELSLSAIHMPLEKTALIRDLRKAQGHLRTLSVDSLSAQQAGSAFTHFLVVFEAHFGISS